ncbi:disease resistance protein RGA2-like [Telopea speciosissima]|uniref:disease resistance protein RGA2-like n=1 Tax=Telopea speciosissima TaxID=54955 RepID=UPI001CC55F19|nr:disease resistance protein RGA2-like [Telopea speciosissima]
MSFYRCPKLKKLPHAGGLSRLTALKNLRLGDEMEGLMQFLDETETLPPNLNRFYIHDCKSLPKGLRNLSSLKRLEVSHAFKALYSREELPANAIVIKRSWYPFKGEGMETSRDDIFVTHHVAVLLDKLSSQALIDFGLVWCAKSELRALSDLFGKIQKLLRFAEKAQARNILVKDCLRNLREVAYRAEDILDEFIYEACKEKDERYGSGKVRLHFPSNLKADGLLRKQEIVPLINDELIKKLEEIEKKLEDLYLRESSGNQKSHGGGVIDEILDTRPKSGSLVDEPLTLGRKGDVVAIKNKLLSNPKKNQKQVSVIAIVGLGGIGKTTLAQLAYNDPDVKKHFERSAWVCVSTNFSAVRLISAILESLTGENPNLSYLEPLQHKLRDQLKGKRVLIILDDVWTEKESDWISLRVAFSAAGEGSRIIVTTRSRRVSSMMHPMYILDLKILTDEECWSIMERHISLNYCSIAPSLEEVGRKIARKCKGLPLAASTLAGLLSSSSDLNHWEEVLNSSMWDLEESDLPAALSLSYYFLPIHLKQCFAYCSVFPKDYIFKKQHLIQLWIAEGFIRRNTTRMKDKAGGQYFDDLLQRSFFQRKSYVDGFVMHDLVHDLAQAVSGELYGRFEYGMKSSRNFKETRYSSMSCVNSINRDKNHDQKRLSTLINVDGYSCSHRNCLTDTFGRLRYLRVLDLYASKITMLPDDIGDLKCLHYINLSFARDIERLPESLCDLFNLQSLILRYSGIRELPRGMKYLRNLQHLDVYGCIYLLSMPQGIGRLSSLKTLSEFTVSKDDNGRGIRELKELRQLEGALSVCSLQNVIHPLDAREADLMSKPKVDELTFRWDYSISGDKEVEVLESLQPHTDQLRSLRIFEYSGLTFPRWLMIDLPSYNKLVSLTLFYCCKCQVLPPIGKLPLLESLCLVKMMKLEEWSSSSCRGEESSDEFPSLRYVTISDCPELRILPQPFLSSSRLCRLSFYRCPKLRMLPHGGGLSRLTSLKNLRFGDEMEGLMEFLNETETESLPPNLNRLYIQDCKSLPKRLRNLSSLEHLEVSHAFKAHYSPEELPTNVIVTKRSCYPFKVFNGNTDPVCEGVQRLKDYKSMVFLSHLLRSRSRVVGDGAALEGIIAQTMVRLEVGLSVGLAVGLREDFDEILHPMT